MSKMRSLGVTYHKSIHNISGTDFPLNDIIVRSDLHQITGTWGVLEPIFRGESKSEFCFMEKSVPEKLWMDLWYVTLKLRIFDILPLILRPFC